MIIAVDFDGTLCEEIYPGIGAAKQGVIEALKRRKAAGDRLILWTCRCGERLAEAVEWCTAHGLVFDAVNSNLPESVSRFNNDCRKVFADEYLEDKAVKPEIYEQAYSFFDASGPIDREAAHRLYGEAMQRGIMLGGKKMIELFSDAMETVIEDYCNEEQCNGIMRETVRAAKKAFKAILDYNPWEEGNAV